MGSPELAQLCEKMIEVIKEARIKSKKDIIAAERKKIEEDYIFRLKRRYFGATLPSDKEIEYVASLEVFCLEPECIRDYVGQELLCQRLLAATKHATTVAISIEDLSRVT
jgi:hypothetical protein